MIELLSLFQKKPRQFGLTEAERAVIEQDRKTRNCLIGAVVCILIIGWLSYPG
jgi:hypothetical protein